MTKWRWHPVIFEMEKEVRIFHSFAASERADKEYYLSLTPSERMEILLELIERWQPDEAAKGFERVYRVVGLGEG